MFDDLKNDTIKQDMSANFTKKHQEWISKLVLKIPLIGYEMWSNL